MNQRTSNRLGKQTLQRLTLYAFIINLYSDVSAMDHHVLASSDFVGGAEGWTLDGKAINAANHSSKIYVQVTQNSPTILNIVH